MAYECPMVYTGTSETYFGGSTIMPIILSGWALITIGLVILVLYLLLRNRKR